MDQSKEILTYLKRVDSKLTALLNKPQKETWVKVSIVQDLTGLKRVGLAKARENGLITMRKNNNSIEYLLESIHPVLLKKQTA